MDACIHSDDDPWHRGTSIIISLLVLDRQVGRHMAGNGWVGSVNIVGSSEARGSAKENLEE